MFSEAACSGVAQRAYMLSLALMVPGFPCMVAVYKKIVPHMRISERHFELPAIEKCRDNFRQFLCLRNFPGCCHVGLCNKYGAPEPVLTTADFSQQLKFNNRLMDRPTTVTFVNGSRDMRVRRVRLGPPAPSALHTGHSALQPRLRLRVCTRAGRSPLRTNSLFGSATR
jgi:hypothetical protein